jgi:hypothetical membrane protein
MISHASTARPVPGAVDRLGGHDLRLSGLAMFLAGAAFLTVTMLAASIAPGYDFHGGKISDLGVISETATLFNVTVAFVGGLNLAGGYLLYRAHRRGWLLAIYAIASIGAVGVGVFPLNTGGLHGIFALLAFVFFNVEALATAWLVPGYIRLISAVAGIVGLCYVVIMVIGDGGNTAVFGAIGHGGSERMIAYPAMVWLLTFGGYLMARTQGDAAR